MKIFVIQDKSNLLFFISSSLLFMALQSIVSLSSFMTLFDDSKITNTLDITNILTSSGLQIDLAWYITSLLFIHLVFGLFLYFLYQPLRQYFNIPNNNNRPATIVFFLLAVIFLLTCNAYLYPLSLSAGSVPFLKLVKHPEYFIYLIATITSFLTFFAFYHWLNTHSIVNRSTLTSHKRALSVVTILTTIIFITHSLSDPKDTHNKDTKKPNIIIIGIDSLRADLLNDEGQEIVPNIQKYIKNNLTHYTNAITPLARTYASWVSILTGQYPKNNNARFNLINPELIDKESTISSRFQENGYHSIFATDERRFSNIDSSYGFDQVTGPAVGFADFIIGTFNDLPLPNLLNRFRISKFLFPFTYANRAAPNTYLPETFNNEIALSLQHRDKAKPLFMAVHYCLPHWPFAWAKYDDKASTSPYKQTLKHADKQFAFLINTLKSNGLLNNTIIVILSDHGESLNESKDTLSPGKSNASTMTLSSFGHGTSVNAIEQHQVVMAIGRLTGDNVSGEKNESPVSLIDIAPTVLELASLKTNVNNMDGIALQPSCNNCIPFNRNRFLESGFYVDGVLDKNIDIQKTIADGMGYYTVTDNGRLVIRDDLLEKLLNNKQRAVLSGDWLLSQKNTLGKTEMTVVNTASQKWWPLGNEPSSAASGKLLQSLCDFYLDDKGFNLELCPSHNIL